MKKIIFCVSLALFAGLMTACIEKEEAVDADKKPAWLGGSIYQELKNPQYLTGSFTNYLHLVDDLGYADVLNRTGSKTVFPANDEAFERFFQQNDWGVRSYADLTDAQKKMLLYSSMLDNALLVGMLSNVSNTNGAESTVTKGMAVKHQTQLSVTDSIQLITDQSLFPQNNGYWDKYRDGQMYLVSDATRPMLVHFTREHMLNNGITTDGDQSDFAILTGTPYEEGMAYVFNDRIIKSDITCQNGYIHQMQDVIVPPGNMAQMLRNDGQTQFFSRVLDYFCAPYENPTVTNAYNAAQLEKGLPVIDMIYERRYLNNQSSHKRNTDPDGNIVTSSYLLNFDPGWNQYSPSQASGGVDYTISDIAAMFVPTDQAVIDFFTEGGDGAYLIDLYGVHTGSQNNAANLAENLDSLFSQKPEILTKFVNNLMKSSFTATVPSKFETIQNDVKEYMGVTLDLVDKKADGTYNISIANNGVLYKMKELIAPDEFQSVMAPSSVYPDMKVMNWAVQDDEQLSVSHHYYLMAMKQKFAFFIPDDEAFEQYYIDPIYLRQSEPRALKFTYDSDKGTVKATSYSYDPKTNEIGEKLKDNVSIAEWKSLFVDILNYHTIVLDSTEVLGANNYYKTKHGGEVLLKGTTVGQQVLSGQQIDNGVAPSVIENVYNEKNGTAFRIDHIIQAPRNSVSRTLKNDSVFSEFYSLCAGFTASPSLLAWAGISATENVFKTTEQDAYIIFTADRGSGSSKVPNSSLDENGNVKMFNTFNYTLYAPNNSAMKKAYAAGLPRWSDIQALYEQYSADVDSVGNPNTPEAIAASTKAKKMIDQLRDFARYHFQSTSVYADNVVKTNHYNSMSTDNLGLAIEINVSGGNGRLEVKDKMGNTIVVDANDATKHVNLMARDYWFDKPRTSATSIYTSSFCVVHEIDTPLNSGMTGLQW